MSKVTVVDYGIGNVFSVCNAVKAAGSDFVLTRKPEDLLNADRLILPGVGAFPRAREALDSFHIPELLDQFINTGRPFLGICVGMQVLMSKSCEFGETNGLAYFDGEVTRINERDSSGQRLRIPHISWANLQKPLENRDVSWANTVLEGFSPDKEAAYFVHSYHAKCHNPADILAEVTYGGQRITAAIRRENILGLQFHPERSGAVGQSILKKFLAL